MTFSSPQPRYCVTKCYTVHTIDMYTGTQVLANVACVTCCVHELRVNNYSEVHEDNRLWCWVFGSPGVLHTSFIRCERRFVPRLDNKAGPVSLVSTGSLFPSLVACLALPINAIARWMPTQGPQPHRWHVETCDMAANNAKEPFQVFQQLSCSHKRTMSCKPHLRRMWHAS